VVFRDDRLQGLVQRSGLFVVEKCLVDFDGWVVSWHAKLGACVKGLVGVMVALARVFPATRIPHQLPVVVKSRIKISSSAVHAQTLVGGWKTAWTVLVAVRVE
jgi:hypothetical protein